MGNAMLPHLPLLMRANPHIAPRRRVAKQNKSRSLILREIRVRLIMHDRPLQQSSRTAKAAALMTDRRQVDSIGCGRIPDVNILSAFNAAKPLRSLQRNEKASPLCHPESNARSSTRCYGL